MSLCHACGHAPHDAGCNAVAWTGGEPIAVRCACETGASGRKNDAGKDPWHLLPTRAVRAVVRVLGHGAALYGADNWRVVKGARERYYAAAMRHITAWWEGEVTDPESGQPHLAHALCCLLFLLEGGK